MKMDYASNSCEGRAHELLAPLTGACPDSVWESISSELEEKRLKAKNNWLNKLNSSRTPLIIIGAITVITIVTWSFFNYKKIQKIEVASTNFPLKPVTVKPLKQLVGNSAAPVAKQVAVTESSTEAANQNTSDQNQSSNIVAVVKNEKHKKITDSVGRKALVQKTGSTKEDDSPLVIHTNSDGEEPLTTSNVAGGKSVEVKLDRADGSITNNTVNQPSAELTSVADSAQ